MTVVLGILLVSSVARANTADILAPQNVPANSFDGWQAGPCTSDVPKCAPDTPSQFFKTAGGHPPKAFVQFIVKHQVISADEIEPLRQPLEGRVPKTVRVDLPPGLSVNPEASAEKCTMAEFLHAPSFGLIDPVCKPGTVLGESQVNLVTEVPEFLGLPLGWRWITLQPGLTQVNLFNLQPSPGEPALFGFVVARSIPILLEPELSWDGDYHESFTIRGLPDFNTVVVSGVLASVAIHSARLITSGTAGDGTLATNPTTCFNADEPQFRHIYSSWIREDSFEQPDPAFPAGTTPVESSLPPGVHPEGCASVPFVPSVEVDPGTDEVDSSASPTVTTRLKVEVPARGGGPIAESQLRSAKVTLPEGMSLNPAGSTGLVACSDAEFHQNVRVATNDCPPGSAIGTAEIRTPVLSTPLRGQVYVGTQRSNDPNSGEEFRVFVEAKSEERGVVVRLIGNVKADPRTGQLTAVFDEREVSPLFGALPEGLPQVPFESIALKFDDAHQLFSTPPTCSTSTTTGRMEPWARPGTEVSPTASFTLSRVPSGGKCPSTLAQRTFAPIYASGPDKSQGGAFSPFRIHVIRQEGQQELKRLDLTLPKGLIGKLAGIPYCPEAAIVAASSRTGAAEQKSPSCPAASMVGTTSTESGTGGEPLTLPGKVYLSGPYKGAPLSLAAITPAVSGPFDLGNVAVRAALSIDPTTAQVHAVSDLLPDVFGGVKLDIRKLDLNLDRAGFTVNPTNCGPQKTLGALNGGGADPTNPAAFSSYPLAAPFQATGCAALGFGPALTTTLSGPTKRGKYPALSTTLVARGGDANLASVALTLPHAFFVAQEHITTVCTKPQLAAHACPASSVYGEAEATSPLLDGKLSGPVYLVPGGHQLPDLVVDLHGQVDIRLHGVISSEKGGIKAVFDSIPDVPVTAFTLRMAAGSKSLIVNSTNTCKGAQRGALTIQAQNGKQLKASSYKLNIAGCKKHRKKHRKHKTRHRN
jgi:hypothetical protein